MKNYFDFTGQVAFITGASSGLGLQMSRALASKGANLVLVARREDRLITIAKEIKEEFKVECLPVKCDITSLEQVQNAVTKSVDKFGKIDILVNNAGIGMVSSAEEVSDEELLREINVDLLGVFRCSREVGKIMIKAGYGRIINIASIYGLVGNMQAPSAPYHAAKGGVVNLTRALAAEWGKYGITVNCICPGYFETELTRDVLNTKEFQEFVSREDPLGRYGNEGELDTTILYLADQNSSYVNGVNLPVDGGYTCI
ncbi:MAG: SDR family oxidoreductase [Dysgonamonadaceae bacterium]